MIKMHILMLILLLVLFFGAVVVCGERQAGVVFASNGFEGHALYGSASANESLKNAQNLANVTHATLSFVYYVPNTSYPFPIAPIWGGVPSGLFVCNSSSPTDDEIRATLAYGREIGVKMVMRAMVDPEFGPGTCIRGNDRGHIGSTWPDDSPLWAQWFEEYTAYQVKFARIAAEEGAWGVCLGAELRSTLGRDAEWRNVFKAVREVFSSGPVWYSAEWPQVDNVTFWDESDFIAVDVSGVTLDTGSEEYPSVDKIASAWQPYIAKLEQAQTKFNRSVLFQEGGRCSVEDGWKNVTVTKYCYGKQADQKVQSLWYQGLFQAMRPYPWFAGLYNWKWDADANAGGPLDPNFTPQNKLAQQVMATEYGSWRTP